VLGKEKFKGQSKREGSWLLLMLVKGEEHEAYDKTCYWKRDSCW
jgi:hypothetical protein